ncbi:MAG TPA: Crp/Fnr family transcriptional regulator [Ruminiclostridium sp.]|nr:Crp/Fnr family transcriptional regulator [Ruminiclostridium sp.]
MLDSQDLKFLMDYLPFINRLDQAELNLLLSTCSKSAYAPGEIILNRDKECNGLVIVKSGQLRAYFESEDGKEITLYRLLSGDICILTASCILKNITFEVTLEVEKDSMVTFVPATTLGKLAEKNSLVKEFSMELVNERFSETMWVMEQMVSKNMGQRVAAFLLEQSALENSETLSMTHETIAKNLGTAREVVSRILKYLENDGLLKLSRGLIALTDLKRLRDMSR